MVGVHPSQVKEANAKLEALRSPGRFDETGALRVSSNNKLREHLRAVGACNYSDQGPSGHGEGRGEVLNRIADAKRRGEWRKEWDQPGA